jgi:hypothetical protein
MHRKVIKYRGGVGSRPLSAVHSVAGRPSPLADSEPSNIALRVMHRRASRCKPGVAEAGRSRQRGDDLQRER